MQYISDRTFQLWGYMGGHSFLLLRSPLFFENLEDFSSLRDFNIDIEFWGVSYLDLPDILRGISIVELKNGLPRKFSKYSESKELKIFEIKSQEAIHYIVSGGCRVGKSSWLTDSRVTNYNLEYDEILALF